jgi:lipid II:glycine glycyltransferase (peptidoglycan interpeptide bridge formation enzyme)
MPGVSFAEWQQFLKNHPEAHLLQTAKWGQLKSSFGWEAQRLVTGQAGVQILFRKLPLGFTLAYIPKPLPAFEQLFPEIDSLCHQKRAIFLKIEPDAWQDENSSLQAGQHGLDKPRFQHGLITSPHNIQPPRTIIIPLDGTEEQALARMKQKCRYNVRLAEKKEITVRAWDDLDGFYRLMQVTGGRDGFGVHSLAYYRKAYELFHPAGMAELLLAEYEGRPLAALMIFAIGQRSWYLYGASNDEERNRMPTYLLQWQAMQWARQRGCAEYDLWGVPDADETELEAQFETRHDGLWGVYRFKRGFGGHLRRAAQALDKIYIPLLYRLYLLRVRKDQ